MVLHSVRNVIDQVTAWAVERRNGVDVDGTVFSAYITMRAATWRAKKNFPSLHSVCNRSGVQEHNLEIQVSASCKCFMFCTPSIAHKLQDAASVRVCHSIRRWTYRCIDSCGYAAAVIVCCWDKSHVVTLNGQCHTLQCREGFVQMDLCNYATLNGGNALVRWTDHAHPRSCSKYSRQLLHGTWIFGIVAWDSHYLPTNQQYFVLALMFFQSITISHIS